MTPYSTMETIQVDINPKLLGQNQQQQQSNQMFKSDVEIRTEADIRKQYKFDFSVERTIIGNDGVI